MNCVFKIGVVWKKFVTLLRSRSITFLLYTTALLCLAATLSWWKSNLLWLTTPFFTSYTSHFLPQQENGVGCFGSENWCSDKRFFFSSSERCCCRRESGWTEETKRQDELSYKKVWFIQWEGKEGEAEELLNSGKSRSKEERDNEIEWSEIHLSKRRKSFIL